MMAPMARPPQRHGKPAYPTRLQVLDDPELLRQHVPSGSKQPDPAGVVVS
jgi:hypothetical protein